MQLFLPSLLIFIIMFLIVYHVLPRLATPALVGVSFVILIFALYHHVTLFKSEYALSTWQEQLKFYAPFVMIAGLLLAIFFYFGLLFSSDGGMNALPTPTAPEALVLPPATTATNSITAAINSGIRSVGNVISPSKNNTVTGNNQGILNTVFGNNKRPGNGRTNANRSMFSPI